MDNKKKPTAKSLQNFTELISIDELQNLILLCKEHELKTLEESLIKEFNAKVNLLGSRDMTIEERSDFAERYEGVFERLLMIVEATTKGEVNKRSEKLRRITYDINRRVILDEIRRLISECNKIPNQTEIACCTGLSRTTVIKHLNDLSTEQEYSDLKNTSAVLLPAIMGKLYTIGMSGDVKALKTFLDFHRGPNTTFIKNQQNNINSINEVENQKTEIHIVSTGVEMKTMEG